MHLARRLLFVSLALALPACATDDPVATAPSELTASPLAGGAQLTWSDNSNDETMFVIMRMHHGVDGALHEHASVPHDSTSYHDEALAQGAMYEYAVIAVTHDGHHGESNHITFIAP